MEFVIVFKTFLSQNSREKKFGYSPFHHKGEPLSYGMTLFNSRVTGIIPLFLFRVTLQLFNVFGLSFYNYAKVQNYANQLKVYKILWRGYRVFPGKVGLLSSRKVYDTLNSTQFRPSSSTCFSVKSVCCKNSIYLIKKLIFSIC